MHISGIFTAVHKTLRPMLDADDGASHVHSIPSESPSGTND